MKTHPKTLEEEEERASHVVVHSRVKRQRDLLQIILFGVVLLLPSIGSWAGINDFDLMAENRRPAERPERPETLADWQVFPAAFERYFDDHFGFRSYLLGRDKRLEWLGRRTDVEIQVGREGWLFQGDARSVESFVCSTPSGADLDRWIELARRRMARFEETGVALYWAMAPNNHSIYPDRLAVRPDRSPNCESNSFAEALTRAGASIINLRPVLASAENASQVGGATAHAFYHKTDTHWNELGAAIAVAHLIEEIRVRFPEVPALRLSDFEVSVDTSGEAFEGDLAKRLRVYGEHYEEPFLRLARRRPSKARRVDDSSPLDLRLHAREDPVVEFETGISELPTAWVFHDSFGYATMSLLAEHFESIRFVNSNSWIDPSVFEGKKPDLVISLFVEGKLRGAPRTDAL